MKTISENEFFNTFMKISQNLTFAETRILYLLITEPYLYDLPQHILANRLKTHRRTINIGLKKIRELNYVTESLPLVEKSERVHSYEENSVTKHNRSTAITVILNSFEDYYQINKKNFIINEDLFCFIIGDIRLSADYSSRQFITSIIKKKYPESKFYFDLKESAYENVNTYYIIRLVNSEILRAQKSAIYRVELDEMVQKISEGFLIEREEAESIIKSQFPKVRLTKKYISLRRPYEAWDLSANK